MFSRYLRRNDFGNAFWGTVLFTIVVVLLGCLFSWLIVDEAQTAAKYNRAVMSTLQSLDGQRPNSDSAIEARKQNAEKLLQVRSLAEKGGSVEAVINLDDSQLEAVKAAAHGKRADLDISAPSLGKVWWFMFVFPIGLIYWMFAGLAILLFGSYSSNATFREAPWRSPLMWLFALVLGPLVWITFFIDWLHFRRQNRPLERVVEVHEEHAANDFAETVNDDVEAIQTTTAPVYRSSPIAGGELYTEIRCTRAHELAQARVDSVDADIEHRHVKLREHADKIRKHQVKLGEARALKRSFEENGLEVDVTPEVAAHEFERIMQLPGVFAVQVVNNGLRFIVKAVIEYDGNSYDGGDWQIGLVQRDGYTRLTSNELRSGVRESWYHRDYPVYRLGDNSFCFGSREYIIDDHLVKGQYLEALSIAVECLNSVNPGDQHNIPSAFYKIKEGAPA